MRLLPGSQVIPSQQGTVPRFGQAREGAALVSAERRVVHRFSTPDFCFAGRSAEFSEMQLERKLQNPRQRHGAGDLSGLAVTAGQNTGVRQLKARVIEQVERLEAEF